MSYVVAGIDAANWNIDISVSGRLLFPPATLLATPVLGEKWADLKGR